MAEKLLFILIPQLRTVWDHIYSAEVNKTIAVLSKTEALHILPVFVLLKGLCAVWEGGRGGGCVELRVRAMESCLGKSWSNSTKARARQEGQPGMWGRNRETNLTSPGLVISFGTSFVMGQDQEERTSFLFLKLSNVLNGLFGNRSKGLKISSIEINFR